MHPMQLLLLLQLMMPLVLAHTTMSKVTLIHAIFVAGYEAIAS